MKDFGLSFSDALLLTKDKSLLEFYKKVVKDLSKERIKNLKKKIVNAILNKKIKVKGHDIEAFKKEFLKLFGEIEEDIELVKKVAKEVVKEFPKAVEDYKKGKKKSLMFLVGQAMREIREKARPNTVKKFIEKELEG